MADIKEYVLGSGKKKDKRTKYGKKPKVNGQLQEENVDPLDEKVDLGIDYGVLSQWSDDNIDAMIADRDEWSQKRKLYMPEFEDMIRPAEKSGGAWEGAANFHVPMTQWMLKQMQARIYAALVGDGYGFSTVAQEKNDLARAAEVDRTMRWAVESYANDWRGIKLTLDDWTRDVCKEGWGVLLLNWERKFKKMALTTEELERFNQQASVEDTLENMIQIVKTFDGPTIEAIEHDAILFPGRMKDTMDLDEPPLVPVLIWMSEQQIRAKVRNNGWSKDAAEKIIAQGAQASTMTGNRQLDDTTRIRDAAQGVRWLDSFSKPKDMFPIWQCFATVDADGDGYDEDLVYWFCPHTKEVPCVTTLDRFSVLMKRPLFKADFLRRGRSSYAIGLAELLYNSQKEATAMHRQRIDFGTMASIPFFFYKPLGGLKKEKMRLAPGKGIPSNNPRNDVYIPNFNNNITFTRNEEALVINYAEKLAGLPAITAGQSPNPIGPAATATGFAGLLNQIGFDFDLVLKNVKDSYEKMLKSMHAMMMVKMPDGLRFRVRGEGNAMSYDDKGMPVFSETNRQLLYGNFDFKIKATDKSLNREVEKQDAIVKLNMMLNPLFLQTGVVTQENIYNSVKNFLMKSGEVDTDLYITKPQVATQPLSIANEIAVILQGEKPLVVINDDHAAKVEQLNNYFSSEMYKDHLRNGYADQRSYSVYVDTVKEHEKYDQMIRAQANPSNVSGLQVGTTLGARIAGAVDQGSGLSPAAQSLRQAEDQGEPDLTKATPSGLPI